jgi:hypothetical protein
MSGVQHQLADLVGVMDCEIESPQPSSSWRDDKGHFIIGYKGGPGRPHGSRPKLSALFWNDLYAVWKAKGMSVLERLADDDPASFAKIASMLVLKDEGSNSDNAERNAAIEAYIEERRQKALKMIAKMDGVADAR